jgi:hypothetical protein
VNFSKKFLKETFLKSFVKFTEILEEPFPANNDPKIIVGIIVNTNPANVQA